MASVTLERRPVLASRLPRSFTNRPALLALAGTAVLAAATRVPYVGVGVGPDEGGYAYVARQWARGLTLYRDVWIDRPQGLLSIYRAIYELSGHLWAFRLGALLLGVGVTLVVGAIGWMLRGPWTGVAAALIYAVVGVGPHIEGFTLNGELAAALPSAGAVACAIAWWKSGRRRWLIAAGVLGGTAILMKQGGFDGLVAAGALAFAASGPLIERARAMGLVAAGAAVPIGAALIHALTVGFGKYWTDVVAFRAGHELHDSTLVGRFGGFKGTFPKAETDLWALAVVALIGLVVVVRRRTERVVVLTWFLAAFVAFNLGGLYWSHYYVQLLPPLVVLAAIGATAFRWRIVAIGLTCLALAPVGQILIHVVSTTGEAHDATITFSGSFEVDERIAAWVKQNTTPADTIYALDSRATLYYLANRVTRYPYIWHHSPLLTPSGMKLLRKMLAGPDRPRIVVLYRNPSELDKSKRMAGILTRGYRLVWQPVKGIRVLVRRDARGITPPPGAVRATGPAGPRAS
jgi:hypothetical protein